MTDRKIVLFSAFRYLLPSDYENWLERMAAERVARQSFPAVEFNSYDLNTG